jgi:PEP-CTERM motif
MPTKGSSVGFHEFLKHPHSETIVLPKLYEPVPAHVPQLSNHALVKLWETNQFSPILRNAAIEKQLYEAVSDMRNVHTERFDSAHPTLGHMFRDPQFFLYALHLYNLDPARFVHYHHALIPVIRGYAMELMQKPPTSGVAPEQLVGPPPIPEGGTNGPPPQPLTIPEPSSLVMMALGLGYVATRIYKRRRAGVV